MLKWNRFKVNIEYVMNGWKLAFIHCGFLLGYCDVNKVSSINNIQFNLVDFGR